MESLKKFVADLNEQKDNKRLEKNTSKKSQTLYNMAKDLEESTSQVINKIEAFLHLNRKYFHPVFGYDGTDLV